MPDPIITPTVALIGAGTWFADKVFGPSAESLGTNLSVYLNDRIRTIFRKAEELRLENQSDLKPIKPGLLTRMIVDASFSDDDENITSWWANLLLEASLSSDNLSANFSDMMAMIGPNEAQCLKEFLSSFKFMDDEKGFQHLEEWRGSATIIASQLIQHWIGETPISKERLPEVQRNFASDNMPWPIRPITWSLPAKANDSNWIYQVAPWLDANRNNIEILERSRILRFDRINVPIMGPSAWVDIVSLTSLGADFYASCLGKLNHQHENETQA